MSRLLPHPHAVLGYRKDGRPIHPILGASEGDPAQPPTPPVRTFTQDEVSQLLAREKQQGARAGIGDVLAQLGFDKIDDLTAFVKAQKDAEAAQLSEVERREKAAAERAAEAEQRIAAAAARERAAERRTTLVSPRPAPPSLLAARAPRLDRALRQIARRGGEVVLIDGTLIPTQRRTGAANARTTRASTTAMACTSSP
ncbi:hypothetical protein ACF1BU_33760 [Streptomyces sp. NPDC014724]|uniref:hypothetical protein n=1 Tax=unclassified Streptomyces TaxID=2593676 RepID=UPI0036FC0AE5